MSQKGIIYLPSYHEAIRHLPDTDHLALYDAILDYGLDGVEPKELPPILQGYFALIRPNLDASRNRYSAAVENGKKGGRPPTNQSKKPTKNQSNNQRVKPNKNQDKEKEKEKDRDKEKDLEMEKDNKDADKPPSHSNSTRFIPPSVDEVKAYCIERGNKIDPQYFVDFYASKGWKVGKEKMKDWKASVRTWEKRNAEQRKANSRDAIKTDADYESEDDFFAGFD
jgi:hypothetical protein